MTKTPEKIFSEARIIIADGVVVKNNTGLSNEKALTVKPCQIAPEGFRHFTA